MKTLIPVGYLFAMTDCVASGLLAWLFFARLKGKVGKSLGYFFVLLGINSAVVTYMVLTLGIEQAFPGIPGLIRITFRCLLTVSEWGMALYFLGLFKTNGGGR